MFWYPAWYTLPGVPHSALLPAPPSLVPPCEFPPCLPQDTGAAALLQWGSIQRAGELGRASDSGRDCQLQPHGAEVEGEGISNEQLVRAGMGALVSCNHHGAPGPDTQPAKCKQYSARALPCSLRVGGMGSPGILAGTIPTCPAIAAPSPRIPGSPPFPHRGPVSPHPGTTGP